MDAVEKGVEHWLKKISAYDNAFKKWEQRVTKIIKRYKDENRGSSGNNESRFNILWSNVNTLIPAVFARLPRPDVSRRFRDNDPVGRVAALIVERALEYEIEHYQDYRSALKNCVLDRFLGGRGVAWVRYEPHFTQDEQIPEDGLQITEDADEADTQIQERLEYECVPVDYVHWKDFGHSIARTWEEVETVWRKVYMGRDALVERFGAIGEKIPLDTKPDDEKKYSGNDDNYQALIYEIWDKASSKAVWISKSMGKILDEKDDPLELENFFPCTKPLYATLTTDDLIPTPDFSLYQDQANELDLLSTRIDGLVNALRIRGVYDASQPELARLFKEAGDNELIPVKNWQAFTEKNGLKGAIDIVDIQPIAIALNEAYETMEKLKNQIFEITGLSDIVRGTSDASESATAQRIKSQFGSLRLRSMQSDVSMFASGILQIKAQLMCKFFQPESLIKISSAQQLSEEDQQLIPQALQLLKDQNLSGFRIDIEADSMIQMDEVQEKQDRMEFLQASGAFMKQAVEAGQQMPELAPLMMDMLKFGVTGFKVGKTVEGQFDQAAEMLKKMAQNAAQNPKPNPEMLKVHAQSQSEQMKMQMQDQQHQRDAQLTMQLEQFKQQTQAEQVQHQNQLEAQREQLKMQQEAHLSQIDMQNKAALAQQQLEFERWKVQFDNETKIMIAKIGAQDPEANGFDMNQFIGAVGEQLSALAGMHADLQTTVQQVADSVHGGLSQTAQQLNEIKSAKAAPVEIVRGVDGKVAMMGGRVVQRDEKGKIKGLH